MRGTVVGRVALRVPPLLEPMCPSFIATFTDQQLQNDAERRCSIQNVRVGTTINNNILSTAPNVVFALVR